MPNVAIKDDNSNDIIAYILSLKESDGASDYMAVPSVGRRISAAAELAADFIKVPRGYSTCRASGLSERKKRVCDLNHTVWSTSLRY